MIFLKNVTLEAQIFTEWLLPAIFSLKNTGSKTFQNKKYKNFTKTILQKSKLQKELLKIEKMKLDVSSYYILQNFRKRNYFRHQPKMGLFNPVITNCVKNVSFFKIFFQGKRESNYSLSETC